MKNAAVVTGASRGIGRSVALALGSAGYRVALQSRSAEPLEAVRAEIVSAGGEAIVVPGDVTKPEAAAELIERCTAELGPVAVAVGGAGQAISAPLHRTEVSDLRQLLDVNLISAFHLIKASSEAMKAAGTRGRIVIVASVAAIKGMHYTSAYSASKHAVLGLVRSAALELARGGITVNAICPGWVDTAMFDQTLERIAGKTGCTTEQAREQLESRVPIGKVLDPEEVAAMLNYVVSDAAAKLTGQALVLDGGETL